MFSDLKYNLVQPFKTIEEARAFVQGVELVNDSSIFVEGFIKKPDEDYEVLIMDEDSQDEVKTMTKKLFKSLEVK